MHDPRLQSPLHAFGLAALAQPMNSAHGVWASEIAHLGYISLRGNGADKAFAQAAAGVLGVSLPVQACTFVQSAMVKVLWLSPDEWMIVCPRINHPALLSGLSSALKGIRNQVVDNSGGYTQIALRGAHATNALTHCTVYNVAALEPGRVVGTTFGKSSVYLHRDGDGWNLLVRRSFADYIWRYLVRAAEPYGFGVATLEAAEAGGAP